jgi:hypothetical protein
VEEMLSSPKVLLHVPFQSVATAGSDPARKMIKINVYLFFAPIMHFITIIFM